MKKNRLHFKNFKGIAQENIFEKLVQILDNMKILCKVIEGMYFYYRI